MKPQNLVRILCYRVDEGGLIPPSTQITTLAKMYKCKIRIQNPQQPEGKNTNHWNISDSFLLFETKVIRVPTRLFTSHDGFGVALKYICVILALNMN